MVADGGPGRDTSWALAWAEDADPENVALIEMYGSFLRGQHASGTDALSLAAAEATMRMRGVPRRDRAELWRRLSFLHGLVREVERRKERQRG